MWGLNFAPRGWALCQGQLLPIAQNTALFSLVGTTYGGDGRTTLGLPNLTGRMPMGEGRGPGLTDRRLGSVTGQSEHTLTVQEIPQHTHTVKANAAGANLADPANEEVAGAPIYNSAAGGAAMAAATVRTNGGSQGHNNQSPYLNVTFTIALTGLFPSRA
jgi:microcystin-dependent protein